MLEITTRPLSAEERQALAGDSQDAEPDAAGTLIRTGLCFVLIPGLAAVLIAPVLSLLGIPRDGAVVAGVVAGLIAGTTYLLRAEGDGRRQAARRRAQRRQDLREDTVETLAVIVRHAWEVDGPGENAAFLFALDADQFVYAASPLFAEWRERNFPAERLEIVRFARSHRILQVQAAGRPLPLEETLLPAGLLPAIGRSECEILVRGQMDPAAALLLPPGAEPG